MKEITQEDLGKVIVGLSNAFADELFNCTDLEKYWHYKHDPSKPLHISIYNFYDMLRLYSGFCRRWEEHHNGSMCVVERVRDKYLMPKIKEFAANIEQ